VTEADTVASDVVFTVEHSVRVAQLAVYQLLDIDREIPPILHHDKSLEVNYEAVIKAFK
jgi:oleate hydratase